jgi:hypothetical protein
MYSLFMKTPKDLLASARAVPARVNLDDHYEVVRTLREKGLAWREIADFFSENGIETDHAKVFRMFSRRERERAFSAPSAETYRVALATLKRQGKINPVAFAMLRHHYLAHNRTTTYTELAEAAASAQRAVGGKEASAAPTHRTANAVYGKLGRMVGEATGIQFAPSDDKGTPFYSSALGAPNPYLPDGAHFQLVMHHELAKALGDLAWFDADPKE